MSNGPLTVIGAQTSKRAQGAAGYRWRGGRLTDEQVRWLTGGADQHALIGEAGTVCLVDTDRCFHFGSRVQDVRPRIVSMFQFVTPLSFRLALGNKAF